MNVRRIMIAAPKSGSGKTTVTCALLWTLKDMGQQAVSYKCGPDYIDPMFHREVLGVPSRNLDTFFTGEEETRALFLKERTEKDFVVAEGVMGLFDGLGGVRQEGSSYHLATVTKTPILLVVDAKGMGRSVIPLIAGFLAYDTEKLIKGVILNRMSKSYFETLKPLLEAELGIPALGYFPDEKRFHLESRHLGLRMPEELCDIRERLAEASAVLQRTVSVPDIMRIAEGAEELEQGEKMPGQNSEPRRPIIAVARDEAFCFYYEENLLLLQECGADLEFFSPIRDESLPEGCSGLLLGGGYPELYAKELSRNVKMREAIRRAVTGGMPTVAECGGFLYLHAAITDKAGQSYAMAGVLPAKCRDTGKLVRFGYIELEETHSRFLPEGEQIRGHEFHYYDSEDNGSGCLASKPVTGKSYPCVVEGDNYWLGFPHLYYPSNPAFAERFTEMARSFSERADKKARSFSKRTDKNV